ncbi:MAG: efflux RND transporter periplasmic adaptor subunit, partial [Anaerolineae bacterium]
NVSMEGERDGATRSLEYARENLEVAQAQYNLTAAGLNRDTAVSASASLANAQQALEQAQRAPRQSEIDAAQLRLDQAALSLEQSEFALAQAQKNLADAQLLAPWSGTALTVEVSPGGMIGAGTPIITLLDTTSLQFQTSNLSERDLAQIQPGQSAAVTLKTFPNEPVSATVARIAPQASGVLGDAALFTVILDLEATELELRPGMTGRVEITNNE